MQIISKIKFAICCCYVSSFKNHIARSQAVRLADGRSFPGSQSMFTCLARHTSVHMIRQKIRLNSCEAGPANGEQNTQTTLTQCSQVHSTTRILIDVVSYSQDHNSGLG